MSRVATCVCVCVCVGKSTGKRVLIDLNFAKRSTGEINERKRERELSQENHGNFYADALIIVYPSGITRNKFYFSSFLTLLFFVLM